MERSRSIDVLRALALFLVCFGRHLGPYPDDHSSYLGLLLHKATVALARGGWVGVDLFFVLSGFLVSGLLLREHQMTGRISASRFLVRRGLKIYPSFWLLILITVTLVGSKVTLQGTIDELIFIQNYQPGLWGHTWSLAVEEHFYILLLVCFVFLSRVVRGTSPFRFIPLLFAILAVVTLLARLRAPVPFYDNLFPSHLRMDSLFFGVVISYFYHYYRPEFVSIARSYRWVLICLGVVAFVPAFIFALEKTPFIHTYGLTLFYFAGGALLVGSLGVELPDHKAVGLLSYVGSHSYSIYIWHVAVANWLLPLIFKTTGLPWNWFSYVAVNVTGTFTVGIAMSLLVEFPALRIRDLLYSPDRSSGAVQGKLVSPPTRVGAYAAP